MSGTAVASTPNPASQTGQPRAVTSVAIFLFALLVRFLNLSLLSRSPAFDFKIGDAARYDAWGADIAAGNWIGEGVFYQAPLYPYFLGSIYTVFGHDIGVVRNIQAFIGAVSCVLLANAAWNLFDRRAGIAAGVVMACYVPSLFLETLLQKTILDLFFVCLILWLVSVIIGNRKRDWQFWFAIGAAIGGLCLTRENALALIPVFGVWSLLCWPRPNPFGKNKNLWPDQAWQCGMLCCGLTLMLLPVAVRNYVVGGEFHLTTSQLGPNFYIGNHPGASGFYQPLKPGRGDARYEQADAVAIATEATGRPLTGAEVSGYFLDQSISFIRDKPLEWLSLMGRKALLSINATEIIDTEDQYTAQQWSPLMRVLGGVFHFGLLAPLGMIGMWRCRSHFLEWWVLYAMAGVFMLTLVCFFVFGRYRFPVVPILILFAAPVVSGVMLWLYGMTRRSDSLSPGTTWRTNGWAVVVAMMLFAVTLIPIVDVRPARATTYNNFGIQMLMRRDYDSAESYFNQSLEIDPDNALTLNSMGVLNRERGDVATARSYFERAIEIEPDLETARRNLESLDVTERARETEASGSESRQDF